MTFVDKLEAAGLARPAPAPPRPRDRGDRWQAIRDWTIAVLVLAVIAIASPVLMLAVIDGVWSP